MISNNGSLIEHLRDLRSTFGERDATLSQIFLHLGSQSHHLLMLFLILPFLQPIPLFGLSTPFGLLIAVVAYFAYRRKPPYLPQRWAEKSIPKESIHKLTEGAEKIFDKISFLIRPRWTHLFRGPFALLSTVLIIINAVLLALPLPVPFSNSFPAWVIFLQALSHIEEDGLFVILSYLQSVICFGYFALLGYGALAGVKMLHLPGL
jgi:hypothetical protein